MLCSIFMASSTQSSSPADTLAPGRTMIDMTRPGIGEMTAPSGKPAAGPRGLGGGTGLGVDRARRAVGRRGRRFNLYWFELQRFDLYLKCLAVDGDFDGRCGQVADFNGIPLSADLNSEDGYRQPPLPMDRAWN